MPAPEILSRLTQAWRRHWARILLADAADNLLEPELPATVFVHHAAPSGDQAGTAARQRSASISTSKE